MSGDVTVSWDLVMVVPSAAYLLGVVLFILASPKVPQDAEPASELAFGALVIIALIAAVFLLSGLGHGFYVGVS